MATESLAYPNQMFAQSLTTPAMVSAHQMTPPPQDTTTTTIKMEDLNMPAGYSTPSRSSTASQSATPSTEQKPVKKRKSWGQVLPEPKTNLPPRKRAKTEDEKEQRRIERVKRNRLAAHNSRERKRQEVEHLQHEKDQLAEELKQAKAIMARMAAQLRAVQQRHPDEVVEIDDFDYNTPSPSDFARESSETVCPRQTSFPSPISMDSMNSPRDDSLQPETPHYPESVAPELDQTRYPAAILCDLQCQSSSRTTLSSRSSSLPPTLAFLILSTLTLQQLSPLSSMRSLLWTIFSTSISSPNTLTTPTTPRTMAIAT